MNLCVGDGNIWLGIGWPRADGPGIGAYLSRKGCVPVTFCDEDAALAKRLTLEVHDFLQHLVRGGDDPGVGLKGLLGLDHLHELRCQIHV